MIKITNPGEADLGGLLLWGATSKSSSAERTIGMFGSGTKYAVLTCLRKGYKPIIYSGLKRIEFYTKAISVAGVEHQEVMVMVDKGKTQNLGAALAMGQHDWGDRFELAMREFVSNALDAVDGDSDRIGVSITGTITPERGTTQVYIEAPWTKATLDEYLQTWFLHFRAGYDPHVEGPIPKAVPGSEAHFYRRGVLIRSSDQKVESLWDYNFVSLNLDEARNSNYWTMVHAISNMFSKRPRLFAKTLKALTTRPHLWESQLNEYALSDGFQGEAIRAELAEAFPDMVLVASDIEAKIVRDLGRKAIIAPKAWVQAADAHGSNNTFGRALTIDAKEGRTIKPATANMVQLAKKWEAIIENAELSSGTEAPVYAFSQSPTMASQYWGFARLQSVENGGGIYLNVELGGEVLEQAVIEELAHWHSGKADFDRGFQEWLIRLLIRRA